MGVETIISLLLSSAVALGVLYTSIYQRKELRGKTRAEQDAISTKASNEALAVIQGGLGKEVTRLGVLVEASQVELGELRQELEETKAELEKMTAERNDLIARIDGLEQKESND